MPISPQEIVTIDPIAAIRARPETFLPGGRTDPATLLLAVAGDVLVGPDRQVVCRRLGAWWVVASDVDWIYGAGSPGLDVFRRVVSFPEAGPNSLHAEILLTAFADQIITFGAGSHAILKGQIPPDDPIFVLRASHPDWNRVIAFQQEH